MDGGKKPRPLPIMIVNLRKQGIARRKNLNNTIQACADKAKAQGSVSLKKKIVGTLI